MWWVGPNLSYSASDRLGFHDIPAATICLLGSKLKLFSPLFSFILLKGNPTQHSKRPKLETEGREKKMLVRRSIIVPNVHFSRGNFFKHLPNSTPTTISCPHRIIGTQTLITTSALSSSYFETLTSHQKDQVHLYVDTLLQWNQVSLSLPLSKLTPCLVAEKTEIFCSHKLIAITTCFKLAENESYCCYRDKRGYGKAHWGFTCNYPPYNKFLYLSL